MKQLILILIILSAAANASAQTLTEKLLRESPKLSINMGIDYESNLQRSETYQNRQSTAMRISPRYRINDNYTLIGSTAFSQSLTQENRSSMTNTGISLSRNPTPILKVADLRPTLSLILPTNEIQRNKDSLQGAVQLTGNTFFRTNTSLILGAGLTGRLNNHRYTVSAINGANLQTMITPFLTLGWALGKFQLVTQSAHTTAWSYRGKRYGTFLLDQSLTYIPNRKMSFAIGHNNSGNVLARDGVSSNIDLFDTRTSSIYLGASYNY